MKESKLVGVNTVGESRKSYANSIFGSIQEFSRKGVSEGEKAAIVFGEEGINIEEILQ